MMGARFCLFQELHLRTPLPTTADVGGAQGSGNKRRKLRRT